MNMTRTRSRPFPGETALLWYALTVTPWVASAMNSQYHNHLSLQSDFSQLTLPIPHSLTGVYLIFPEYILPLHICFSGDPNEHIHQCKEEIKLTSDSARKKLTHLLRTHNCTLLTNYKPGCSIKRLFTVMSRGLSSLWSHWLTWIQFIENCYEASHQNRHKSQGKWINGLSHCLL